MTISTYIIDRVPNRFGNKQAEYLAESKRIVAEGTKKVQTVIANRGDLRKGFMDLLEFLEERRNAVAIASGIPNARDYGMRRDREDALKEGFLHSYTILTRDAYQEYGDKKLVDLQKRLTEIPQIAHQFSRTKLEKREPDCLGRQSDFEIEIVSNEEIKKRDWLSPPKYETSRKANKVVTNKALTVKEQLKCLSQVVPELWNQERMQFSINGLNRLYPSVEKTHFVVATARLQINGKLSPISKYITWLNCNGKEDPVALMTGKSKIYILHHDCVRLDETLRDIAAIFEKAVQWKKGSESVKELKDPVGLLRYLFGNAMPEFHGSGAIGEYLENIVYCGIHGFDLKYADDKSIDLEALTSSLPEFMKGYDTAVTLTERSENKVQSN